jgi:hypothetical protein
MELETYRLNNLRMLIQGKRHNDLIDRMDGVMGELNSLTSELKDTNTRTAAKVDILIEFMTQSIAQK